MGKGASGGMRPKMERRGMAPPVKSKPFNPAGKLRSASSSVRAPTRGAPPLTMAAGGVAKERKGQTSTGKPRRSGGA